MNISKCELTNLQDIWGEGIKVFFNFCRKLSSIRSAWTTSQQNQLRSAESESIPALPVLSPTLLARGPQRNKAEKWKVDTWYSSEMLPQNRENETPDLVNLQKRMYNLLIATKCLRFGFHCYGLYSYGQFYCFNCFLLQVVLLGVRSLGVVMNKEKIHWLEMVFCLLLQLHYSLFLTNTE